MSENKKRLVIIDAHAVLHRAYHALPEFLNSRGEPTGALYGLSTMLLKIISDLNPDYIVAAYDLPKPTFRHKVYKEYKEGRAKAEPDLVSQMIRSREVFEAFGIPIYDKEGFEADDIIGTIVHQLQTSKLPNFQTEIIIASGDMDALQLVDSKRVQVYTLKKGLSDTILYDEEKVKERFGFSPILLPDYKGLAGDPSDNIKGVKGIGDKTATELIKKFGSIENIYRELQTTNYKLQTNIKPRTAELLKNGEKDAELSKMLATIRTDAPIEFILPEKKWKECLDLKKAESFFQELEFRALGERLKNVVGGTPTTPPRGLGTPPQAGGDTELREEKVALWLINSNLTNPTAEDVLNFAHTNNTGEARAKLFAELRARSLMNVFEEIEKPLVPVIEKMNALGVKIDTKYLEKLSKEYHSELAVLEKRIWELTGVEFNINSPKQLGEMLFVKMGLKAARQKKTAGGALSTRESELEKLRSVHPIIGKILEYREFQKLLSTYIDPAKSQIGDNGAGNTSWNIDEHNRLHTNFLQAGTTTGRMSSQNPNLQNIPTQTERGRKIRNAFVAGDNKVLLAFDYSQIELRIAAILSGDPTLVSAFRNKEDIHSAVAQAVFSVSENEVTKEMRRAAKVINFGILYGMGVTALQASLESKRAEAQKFLDNYFAKFKILAEYIEESKAAARIKGYSETLFGRRRYFEALNSPIQYIRAAAERQAVNAPIQGTAADMIKLAMVRADGIAPLILQVHDELVYEVEESEVKKVVPKIKEIMENVLSPKLSRGVPIAVDVSVGKNWGEMEKI